MAIAAVAAVVVLLVYGKKFDRVVEREQRRSARLGALKKESAVVDVQPVVEVVPASEVSAIEQTKVDEPVIDEQKAE